MAGFWSRCRLAPAPNAAGTVVERKAINAEYLIRGASRLTSVSQPRIPGNFFAARDITVIDGQFLDMISDEALMLEFQGGSRQAFEELFARYREPLYGFFRRRLESKERADDLTQETFLAVIRATSRYQPQALVRTYLYGIALKLLA